MTTPTYTGWIRRRKPLLTEARPTKDGRLILSGVTTWTPSVALPLTVAGGPDDPAQQIGFISALIRVGNTITCDVWVPEAREVAVSGGALGAEGVVGAAADWGVTDNLLVVTSYRLSGASLIAAEDWAWTP